MADETSKTSKTPVAGATSSAGPETGAGAGAGAVSVSGGGGGGGTAAAGGQVDPAVMADDALKAAGKAADKIAAEAGQPSAMELPDLGAAGIATGGGGGREPAGLSLLNDVNLNVKVELGRTRMYVEDVLRLNPDSVIELDKAAGDPVDIFVNERLVARGEVLVVNDNFCVRVSEIIQSIAPKD